MFFEWHFAAETARRMIEEARRSRELRRIMGIRSAQKELPELFEQFQQFKKESRNPELSDIARKNLEKSVTRLRKKFCTVHEQAYGSGKKLVGVVASDSQKYCHLSLAEKFAKALMLAIDSGRLSEGLTEQLRQMATPESLAQMAGMFFAVAGVHALVHETPAAPAAWLVDATFWGLGGRDLIISITNIYLAVKDICNERDLRQAADDVASELSGPASGALVNLLLWGLGRTAGRVKQKYELDPSLVILCTNPSWPFHWLRKKKKKKSTDGDESSSGSEIQRGFTVQEASDGIHYEIVTSDGRVLPFRFSDVDSARIWCEKSNAPRVVGELEYVHQLKANKVTDLAELNDQVNGQIRRMNEIIRDEGMAGLKQRIRNYNRQLEQQGRKHIRDNLAKPDDGMAWLHEPDMRTGGLPTDVTRQGNRRINSIIGGQADKIAQAILDMSDDVTEITSNLLIRQAR